MFLHRLTDADARAIATYLKALPPVRNAIPDPLHYGTLETLAVKLTRTLPAVPPKVLTYTEGNFGARGGGMASLRNDPLGKGMAQVLLAMPVRVPPGWLTP